MDDIKSFVIYRSVHEALSPLSDEMYGKIMRAIGEYALNGTLPDLQDPAAIMAFTFVKPLIDSNNAKKTSGKKGGIISSAKKQEIQPDLFKQNADTNEADAKQTASTTQAQLKQTVSTAQADTKQNQATDKNVSSNEDEDEDEDEDIPAKAVLDSASPPLPEEAHAMANMLYLSHKGVDPNFSASPADVLSWAVDIEKLNRVDHRPWKEIEDVIKWSQVPGSFWSGNIISGKKLCEKFPQLIAQMLRPGISQKYAPSPPENNKVCPVCGSVGAIHAGTCANCKYTENQDNVQEYTAWWQARVK
jgi:hypothetical protein